LAEDGAANWVQACSTCLSLSPWSGTIIPRQRTATCFNSSHTATTAVSDYRRPCRSADSSFHRRWPGLPCCRSSGVEQPASLGYISSNAQHIQAAAENRTFHSLLWSAVFLCTQTFCLILYTPAQLVFFFFFLLSVLTVFGLNATIISFVW